MFYIITDAVFVFLHMNLDFLQFMASTNSHAVLNFIFCIMILLQCGQATTDDTMVSSQALSITQTLISATKKFELGFFTPANASTRYVGIWFKSIPETILWEANRENPVSASDESAKLILSNDANLRILDGNLQTVWSTNISVQLNSSVAVLSDDGELVIKDNSSGLVVWKSFSHPCDVFLMTMQLEFNTKTGAKQLLSSWKSENDPDTGSFTAGLLPQGPVQAFVWKGEAAYWRSGPWNGLRFVGVPDTDSAYLDGWSIRQNKEEGVTYFGVNQYDQNSTTIMKLFTQGSLKIMDWTGVNGWNVTWEAPQNPCDVYGMCGQFGVCNANESPICSCPRGFVPKSVYEWGKGNWSSGCLRRTQLQCLKNSDGFWKMSRMKVPDDYEYLASVDSKGCKESCLENCSCTGYAYVSGIGCLVWNGNLLDMQEFSFSGEDVFLRLDHSELVTVGSKKMIITASLLGALFFIILCLLITFGIHKVRNKEPRDAMDSSLDAHRWGNMLLEELATFEFEDIMSATNGFSNSNKVGQGGFGAVFKGKLNDGQEIAVKRLSGRSGQGVNEFLNEILLISKLQHINLVKVLGCCIKGEEKLIVYEYLPNRSLDTFLFDSSKKHKLDWATRLNIIQGIARGISYLHKDSRLKVIHRDLKASNVLLDNDMNPKISDFGLARKFQASQESDNTRRVVGTFGYMSPEYALRGRFSEKSDVFSFGVLLMEIISGKKVSTFDSNNESLGLIGDAWKLWSEGREMELIDETLQNCLHVDDEKKVVRCINVALLCAQDRADDRPTMSAVVLMLSSDMLISQPKQPLYFPDTRSSEGDNIYSGDVFTESLIEGR